MTDFQRIERGGVDGTEGKEMVASENESVRPEFCVRVEDSDLIPIDDEAYELTLGWTTSSSRNLHNHRPIPGRRVQVRIPRQPGRYQQLDSGRHECGSVDNVTP